MIRDKRKYIRSASQIGFCLVCGGKGECKCPVITSHSAPVKRRFINRAEGFTGLFFYCPDCGAVSQFSSVDNPCLCECGRIFKHDFVPSVLPERDYSDELNIDELPKRALRKPRI